LASNIPTTDPSFHRPPVAEARAIPRWLPPIAILNLVGLVVALGLAGFVFYEQHEQSKVDKPIQARVDEAEKTSKKVADKEAGVETKVQDLSRNLEERPAPTNFAPQIKTIEDRLADLGKSLADLNDQFTGLNKKVDAMSQGNVLESSPKFASVENRLTEVSGTLETLKAKVAAMTTPVALAADEMSQAVAYFKQGKWTEARNLFTKLQADSPDDARVWYFSALAEGLASRDWKGEPERLVAAGMAREKAGKPDKAKIDAAFADLTPATGQDWLAFYRSRAGSAPDHR